MKHEISIRAIAFQEDGVWVIQGLEHDIVAHAAELSKLHQAFTRAVVENMCINDRLGRNGLEGIRPAPDRFHDLYETAETQVKSVRPSPASDHLRINDDIRVLA
jgi:hypothetical protein